MGILITIISLSTNRFNEQLKITADISKELNDWQVVKSTIWQDFYMADSIHMESNELVLFSQNKLINYKIQDDVLYRSNNGLWQNLKFEVEAIKEEVKDDISTFSFEFPWKDQTMKLSYHYLSGVDQSINNYFNQSYDSF